MGNSNKDQTEPHRPPVVFSRRTLWFLGICVLVIIVGVLWVPRPAKQRAGGVEPAATPNSPRHPDSFSGGAAPRRARAASALAGLTPEEIVAGKVTEFARNRRALVEGIARRAHKTVPREIERFFDAVEAGRWEELNAQWRVLATHSAQYDYSTNHWEDLDSYWPAVLDAYGVAEQAHLWPAQKLLDYGNAVLGSLRPGMAYVGGTDNGRWIPELLNETSGDPHIIVTQNALADSRYLDFVNTLYGDQMNTLTKDDSQAAFQAYVAEAQKRYEHDQQFPDEPKQLLPGEDLQWVDGKLEVKGQTAVMAINERLMQMLMQKNPDLSFAIEESFPLKGTYGDALPLGPLMELGAANTQNQFTPEQAAQSLQYWQNTAQQVLADPEAVNSEPTMRSYSHDAVAAANLLAAHNFSSEAQQAYELAAQLWPGNPEAVSGLADVLAGTGREAEGRQLLQDFAQRYPDLQKELQRMSALWRIAGPAR